ncbi:hypothetical protein PBY51_008426 [Eleginops maclovinus]|uniref:Uncharacterized protein n=1 Tax=Eleginops maclovinus TaxID=56733 RepID=A0AAN7X9Y9_ELEMC|nr:hypothetical protein PBY51_008426 [Eleginops maclovinus]
MLSGTGRRFLMFDVVAPLTANGTPGGFLSPSMFGPYRHQPARTLHGRRSVGIPCGCPVSSAGRMQQKETVSSC